MNFGTRPSVSRHSASTVALDISLPPLAPPPSEVRIGLARGSNCNVDDYFRRLVAGKTTADWRSRCSRVNVLQTAPERIADVRRVVRDVVHPGVRGEAGDVGYLVLGDPETGRALWRDALGERGSQRAQ